MHRPWTRGSGSAFSGGASSPRNRPTSSTFEQNLEHADTWLSPFTGYGQSNFLVGYPEFDFETYHAWFDERFPPAKFAQLKDKMGPMVQYAIGAFIQSLAQNPGIEEYLQSLGTQATSTSAPASATSPSRSEQTLAYERRCVAGTNSGPRPSAAPRCARIRTANAIPPRRAIPPNFRSAPKTWIDAKHDVGRVLGREERRARPNTSRKRG